jgi:hypothetical protein
LDLLNTFKGVTLKDGDGGDGEQGTHTVKKTGSFLSAGFAPQRSTLDLFNIEYSHFTSLDCKFNMVHHKTPTNAPPSIKERHRAFKMAFKRQNQKKVTADNDTYSKLYVSIPIQSITTLEMIHTPRFVLQGKTIQTLLKTGATSCTKNRVLSLLHNNKHKTFVLAVFKQYSSFTTYTIEAF